MGCLHSLEIGAFKILIVVNRATPEYESGSTVAGSKCLVGVIGRGPNVKPTGETAVPERKHPVIQGVKPVTPEVELQYIPRSFSVEPRVRVTVFRDTGSAILEIQNSVIAEFCDPKSDGGEDTLAAFRESIPTLQLEIWPAGRPVL
jgi:hypothetical protein